MKNKINIMKWIRTYDNYKYNKNQQTIDEGLLGNMFKNLKEKVSLKFSKNFGNAAKADKVIEDYKKEILNAQSPKREAIKNYGRYIKEIIDTPDNKDDNKAKNLIGFIQKTTNEYNKNIDIIKQKFDIKFKEVVDNEKNKKILNYIQLKKIEMQQELLKLESQSFLTDVGLTEEEAAKFPEAKKILDDISTKLKTSDELMKDQQIELEGKEKTTDKFDFEKAKLNPMSYKWVDSPYTKNYDFKVGDEITAWINKSGKDVDTFKKSGEEYNGTKLFIQERKEGDDTINMIRVSENEGDINNSFQIFKTKVITTKSDQEKEEENEENKEEETI